jgi:hypothetical protein
MGALTLRLADDRYARLRALANFNAETRFKLYAKESSGMAECGLQLLDKAAAKGMIA